VDTLCTPRSETTPPLTNQAAREKRSVALSSVLAAIVLTGTKLVVGLATGSLGLLSEAAHSGLDLVAAAVTYIAVRLSGKPADIAHRYGHGKIENLSALVETLLLVVTCMWIVREGVSRLLFKDVHVDATVWSFAVIIGSIVVDVSRSRALMRVARKHRSQALEADALHFGTDVWSSAVVLLGLVLVKVGEYTGTAASLQRADAIAALCVALIVVVVCWRLGRRAIDALLDRAPDGCDGEIESTVRGVPGVVDCTRIRIREAGSQLFVEVTIIVCATLSVASGHAVADATQESIQRLMPYADVVVHVEPSSSGSHASAGAAAIGGAL
jgi:cation diffusion facilitator family transporter